MGEIEATKEPRTRAPGTEPSTGELSSTGHSTEESGTDGPKAKEPGPRDSGPIVQCAEYRHGARAREVELEDVSEVLKGDLTDRFVWIGLHEPDEKMLRHVQEEFGLHDLAVEDALRAHQRPKVEEYGDGLFVVLRTAYVEESGEVGFGETHIFAGPHYVVSIRHGDSHGYQPVRQRAECTPQLLRQGPGFALYALMDFIVDNYFPVLEEFEDRIDQLEHDIFDGAPSRGLTQRIYELKRELMRFKRAVSPLVEVCNRLLRFDVAFITPETRNYLRDVHDHVLRVNEATDTLRELLASALEANLALVGTNQNEVAKQLAGWAAIIAVPTLIAGVYGMNFEFMPELHWKWGYPIVMGAMLTICFAIFRRFRRAGWL
jgi:magnesium transporter